MSHARHCQPGEGHRCDGNHSWRPPACRDDRERPWQVCCSAAQEIRMLRIREAYRSKWMWVITGTVVGASLGGVMSYVRHRAPAIHPLASEGEYCDSGIGAAKVARAGTMLAGENPSVPPIDQTGWIPKINDAKAPQLAPPGMSWIPGGQFWMGSDETRMKDARPWHRVYIDGYWMDRTEVTNVEFARFVKATGYVTVAERKPRAEDYPQALPGK